MASTFHIIYVGEYAIGENVDISYEMNVDNKRFEAAYYQVSESDKDTTGLADWATDKNRREILRGRISDLIGRRGCSGPVILDNGVYPGENIS